MSIWAPREDRILRSNRSLTNEEISGKLADQGYFRTPKGVSARRAKLAIAPTGPLTPAREVERPQNPTERPDPPKHHPDDADRKFLKAIYKALTSGDPRQVA